MKTTRIAKFILVGLVLCFTTSLHAQVPQLINYQGRVVVGTTNFNGTGSFKFALVDPKGQTTYWSNDGTSSNGSEPTNAVSLTVTNGLYSVLLGDTSLANNKTIPPTVFTNSNVYLRVWFNDGTRGSQQLTPDQRIAAVGYAMLAGNVPDGTITGAKIASGTITSANIANGAVGTAQLGSGAVTAMQLAPGVAGTWQNVATTSQQAQSNTSYLINNAAQVTLTLPASPSVGDTVRVSGAGTGGFKIAQNIGQSILNPGEFVATPRENNKNWASVVSSADGTKLVALDYGGGIYISADSGVNWTRHETNRSWNSVASSGDGTKLVAVDYAGGLIYTSTDSGLNWTPRESNRNWVSVASSADGSKLVALVNGGLIYTSIDSGVNWTQRDSSRNWKSVASSSDGTKLVAVVYGGLIYTSTDSGVSWTPSESNRTWFSVASSADGIKLVAVVGLTPGQIYTSIDSGVTWTPRDSNRDWRSVTSSSDGSKLVAGDDSPGQIYTSADSGVSWVPRESTRRWISVTSSADGSKLVALDNGGQIYTVTVSTTVGAAGYLTGAAGAAIELVYIGNGQWLPSNHEGMLSLF